MHLPSYLLGKKAGGGGSSNYQSKSVEITENGTTSITADTGYDALSNVNVTTNIQPDLESKTITITENTTTLIEPTQGKDGLSSVSVTTNISGGGKYAPKWIMFDNYYGYVQDFDIDVENLDCKNLTSMNKMFYNCRFKDTLANVVIELKNTYNVTDMSEAFNRFITNTNLTINIDTSSVTNMNSMCGSGNNLRAVTFGEKINTDNVTNMATMFTGDTYLASINGLNKFNTSNVTTMTSMFNGCGALISLDLSNFNTKKVTTINYMFNNCSRMTTITFGEDFELPLATNLQNMFNSCNALDDNTLNAILHICTTAVNSPTKTLAYLGITNSTLLAKIPTLSNYQEFMDAGWTIS